MIADDTHTHSTPSSNTTIRHTHTHTLPPPQFLPHTHCVEERRSSASSSFTVSSFITFPWNQTFKKVERKEGGRRLYSGKTDEQEEEEESSVGESILISFVTGLAAFQ